MVAALRRGQPVCRAEIWRACDLAPKNGGAATAAHAARDRRRGKDWGWGRSALRRDAVGTPRPAPEVK
jgi:hypothetical protein